MSWSPVSPFVSLSSINKNYMNGKGIEVLYCRKVKKKKKKKTAGERTH